MRDGVAGRDSSILVERLTRRYGDFVAVNAIDLQVPSGGVFGFLGPNGAGKTTLVKVLTTILAPSEGRAVVAGYDVSTQNAQVRRAIGVALQEVGLDTLMTARELLVLQGRLFDMSAGDAESKAEELLRIVGLDDVATKKRVAEYSGGMKRRLDLALALVHRPRILFLDEPTTGLDPASRTAIWDEVRRLNRDEGITIFLTTQYLEEADRLADEVAIIDHGVIVAQGSPAQLKSELGDSVVTIELSSREAAARASNALADLAERRQIAGAELVAYTSQGTSVIPEVVRRLDAEGLAVVNLSLSEPTLDDVFLRATGGRLSGGARVTLENEAAPA